MRLLETTLLFFLAFNIAFPAQYVLAKQEDPYLIGREDVLDITVWQSPDLTKAVTVQSDGTIDYPILGNLPAAGLTMGDLERAIRERLAQGYVKDPRVSIAVKEYNSKKILVFGEVGKPGLYKLKGQVPLLELLFMVGGAKSEAKRMTVIRPPAVSGEAIPSALIPSSSQEPGHPGTDLSQATVLEVDLIALLSKGDLTQNIMIQAGDTLYVASGTGLRYYVLGQVRNPGPYEWSQDITVLEAIKLAGGANERAAANRIKVRKIYQGEKQDMKVNVLDIMKGRKKDDVIIKAGDIIIVPESWI